MNTPSTQRFDKLYNAARNLGMTESDARFYAEDALRREREACNLCDDPQCDGVHRG